MTSVSVLLSTYNGSVYLIELLNSLLMQDFNCFKVYIRDDSSTDNTCRIINDYCSTYPEKFIFLTDDLGNLGSSKSFMQMLSVVNSDYYFLCDQDDIWLPKKISTSISFFNRLNSDTSLPVLLFTDLTVVDSKLRVINKSFWEYQCLFPELSKSWKKVLSQNVAAGCTMSFNKAAKNLSLPYVLDKMYHDHWLITNVSKYGKVYILPDSQILYRQHGGNELGANYSFLYVIKKLFTFLKYIKFSIYACSHFKTLNPFYMIIFKIVHSSKRVLYFLFNTFR